MSRSVAAELEAQLRAAWSWDTLSVWADALLGEGDPRGERIAIDLAPVAGESWRGRRRAILNAWLGSERAGDAGHLVQHGFAHELRFGAYPAGTLRSPIGDVMRGFSVTGGPARVAAALAELAAAPRPWLARLAIDYTGETPLDGALAERVIAATPALTELVLTGRPVFAQLAHPALRLLRFEPRAEVSVPAACAGERITRVALTDVALLLELVDATPDINQLHAAYAELIPAPLPALLAQLEAAGLVALDGPLARLATAEREPRRVVPPVPPEYPYDPVLVLFVDHHVAATLGTFAHHAGLVHACLAAYPLAGAAQQALGRHLAAAEAAQHARHWDASDVTQVPGLRRATNALVELRALWPSVASEADGWLGVEQLATTFARVPAHASLSIGRRWRGEP